MTPIHALAVVTILWLATLSQAQSSSVAGTDSPTLEMCASFPPVISYNTRELSGADISDGQGSKSFTIGGNSSAGIFAAADDVTALVQIVRRDGVLPRVTEELLYPLEKGGSVGYSVSSTQVDDVVGASGYSSTLDGGLVCTVSSFLVSCRWPQGVGSGYESWQDEHLDVFLLLSPSLTLRGACRIPTENLEAPQTSLQPNTPLTITLSGVQRTQLSNDTVRMYVGSVVITATPMNNWLYLGLRGGLVVAIVAGICAFILFGDTSFADLLIAIVLLDQICATTTDHAHVAYARYAFRPFSAFAETHVEIMYYGAVVLLCTGIASVALAYCYITANPPGVMKLELEGPMSRWFQAAANSRCTMIVFIPALLLLPGTAAATCRLYTLMLTSGLSEMSVAQLFALFIGPLYCLVILISIALISHHCGGSAFSSGDASYFLQMAVPDTVRIPPMSAVAILSPWYVRSLYPPLTPSEKGVVPAKSISIRVAARALRLLVRRRRQPKTYDENGNSVGSSDTSEIRAGSFRGGGTSLNDGGSLPMDRSRRPSAVTMLSSPRQVSPREDDSMGLHSPSVDDIKLVDCPKGPRDPDMDPFESIRRAAAMHREEVRPAPQPPKVQDPDDLCGVALRNVAVIGGIDIRPTVWKRLFYPTTHWGCRRYRSAFPFLIGSATSTAQLRYLAPLLPHFVVVCVAAITFSGTISCEVRSYGYAGTMGLNLLLLCLVRPYRYRFAAVCGLSSSVLLAAIVAVGSYSLHALPVSAGFQITKDALLAVLIVVCLLRSIHVLGVGLFVESGIDAVMDKVWNRITGRQEVVYMYHYNRSKIPVFTSPLTSPLVSSRKEVEVGVELIRPDTGGGGPTSSRSSSLGAVAPYPVDEPTTLSDDPEPTDEAPTPFPDPSMSRSSITSAHTLAPTKSCKRQATLVRNMHRYQYSNPTIPDEFSLNNDFRLSADDAGCIVIVRNGSGENYSASDNDQ